jgi:glutamate/tyrosine decarboxylase-like PLP-dependent enzyme
MIHLENILAAAREVAAEIAAGPIVPSVRPPEIRDHLMSRYSFREPIALEKVTADVEDMLRRWQVHVTHPRYFGLFNPSVTPESVIADTLAAMYNPQLATWRTSPAANEIERHTLMWLARKFGLPDTAIANFTTGGAEANLSAVIAALTRAFPHYREHGVQKISGRPVIYTTAESHHSFSKIAHMAGLGRSAIRTVSTDPNLKMDVSSLERVVDEDQKNGLIPVLVVGTAGTTAAGVIDPLAGIAGFCKSRNLWFHVDAAWGGAAAISPNLRKHLEGIESADSITCDAHKWFSVAMGSGMFFCRHPDAVTNAFGIETSFMPSKVSEVVDPYTTTVQWSRRFIGLKLFLSLAHRGEDGYISMIEHQTRMGDVLRECLTRAGWRLVNETPLPLVCFTRDGLHTSDFLAKVLSRQIVWIAEVRLAGGAPVLRACITSFRTSEADIEWAVQEMTKLV